MTTHILNFGYTTGQTLTARLFEIGSDDVAATASSVTEATNRKGRYAATFSDVDAGDYLLIYSIGGTAAGSEYFTVAGTDSESLLPWSERYAPVDTVLINGNPPQPLPYQPASQDTLLEVQGAVEGIGSGSGGIIGPILPGIGYVPKRGTNTKLEVFEGETITQFIDVYQADGITPMDLSGYTLEMVFERATGVDVDVIEQVNLEVSGEFFNRVVFKYTTAITEKAGTRNWALRDTGEEQTVFLQGSLEIKKSVKRGNP